ncbi:unnamed protein product [Phaedon cochleariae]|uniref:Centromere/kinetochore protein zw10 n=1 Tax=Phaedon cochleariae TaxID=80249 RepID=A0A9N9SFB9_PHACE|nr:unnamed protein product [Phaedon cochleariae]
MNFLAEVLSSAEEVELEEINRKVPELKLMIDDVKSDVVQYLENVYVKYSCRPKQNRELLNQIHDIEDQINSLKKYAESATKKDLSKSSKELKKNVESLEILNFTIDIVSKLSNINEKLIEIDTLLIAGEYLKGKQLICELESLLTDEIPTEDHLEIMRELSITIHSKRNDLLNALENVFNENVIMKCNENYASIEVLNINEKFEGALLALCYQTEEVDLIHNLINLLWNSFLLPAIDKVVDIVIGKNEISCVIQITIKDSTKKSHYSEVFDKVRLIMEFLREYFNFKLNDDLTTLEYICRSIRDNLSEILIKSCLADTIPSTVEGLQKYKTVIEDTKKLEDFLRESKIFVDGTASLVEYANNVDVLFMNKKCLEYTTIAIQIMKKDLHDMIEVGEPFNPDSLLSSMSEDFQQCSVSKSTIALLQLTEKIMQKAIKGSDVCGGRLFYTAQHIMREYGLCVPEYHKKLLQTIPQQVALFHNNCLYICHKLTKWNDTYCQKLPSTCNTGNLGFTNEINQLQHIASEMFSNYVKEQIKHINEIMKDSGLDGVVLEELQPVTEKSVRQCLRQQELLKTVWQKVLPFSIYNRTLGAILNSLCTCIISSVLKYEGISSKSAEQLMEIIKMILVRGPKLFSDPKEITLFVVMWYKLNELDFVLGASLLDIKNRWADGKGPLALHFKPSELKSLIRALFQNTARRSAVLAKIIE